SLRAPGILAGKLVARLMHVGGLVLTGLPVFGMVAFWGGVDPNRLLAEFAAAGLTLLAIGALSLWVSAHAPTTRSAVIWFYAILGVSLGYYLLNTRMRLPWDLHRQSPFRTLQISLRSLALEDIPDGGGVSMMVVEKSSGRIVFGGFGLGPTP